MTLEQVAKIDTSYISKRYLIDLFSDYFCGDDAVCDGDCDHCYKGEFIDTITNDTEHTKEG